MRQSGGDDRDHHPALLGDLRRELVGALGRLTVEQRRVVLLRDALDLSYEEIGRMAQSEPKQAARIRARYQAPERREALKDSIRERKALAWLIDAAEIQNEEAGATPAVVPAGR